MDARRTRRRKVAVASVIAALAAAGTATAAFQQLPPGDQVNNDPAAGINPNLPVNTEDPANADVVGGSLVATKPAVPWAVFRQTTSSGHDQIFSRSFAGGVWTTRGNGTVGGLSSASPTFSGSLNFDQGQDGEAPSIDFAGAGRTVPWATWYEQNTHFGKEQIFASRFDNSGDANQGKWIFSGQDRGGGVPSLNINTNQDAENPVVAGGSTADPTKPGPWVTWQEEDANSISTTDQIFVSKPIGPGTVTCPAGTKPSGTTAIGGFCFQQVGIDRVNSNADPSLNVDPSRDGVEPDMTFTGANDAVPWVVWYEQNSSGVGLHNNEMVFAAKATSNLSADGLFQWTAVGINGAGLLDTSGTTPTNSQHFGSCATTQSAEEACSVNKNVNADAEDPRIAAGTMAAGNPTVPWIVWDEGTGAPNDNSVFVARLVGTGAAARFVIANGGNPVGTGDRTDITFSGNTPYVTWHHNNQVVTGHFITPDSFTKDGAPIGTNTTDEVRAPISSGCTANPFNLDGAGCQAGAAGTPFFLFTDSIGGVAKLFAQAYAPDSPATLGPTGVSTSGGTLNGSVNPEGAAVKVSFQFGATTSYTGGTTAAQKTAVSDSPQGFSANVAGLAPGTRIHYRAVATSDFGTFFGNDQVLKTGTNPVPHKTVGHASVSGTTSHVRVSCVGAGGSCKLAFRLTVTERKRGSKIIAISARKKQPKIRKVIVTVGSARTITLGAGKSKVVSISLNGTGKSLLKSHHTLKLTLDVTQLLGGGHSKTSSQSVTFHAPKPKKKHHH